METIKTKAGIKYREKIYINGKSIASPLFERKSDANIWKRRQASERDTNRALGLSFDFNQTFEEFYETWLKNKKAENPAKRTIEGYISVKAHIMPHFGDKKLLKITKKDGLNFKAILMDNNSIGFERKNFILRVLKQVFNDAIKGEYLPKNPLATLDKFKIPERSLNYWNQTEIGIFLNANQGEYYCDLFEFMLNTGLRKGEVLGLCFDKVDLGRRVIEISRIVDRDGIKSTTKTGKIRHVPLNSRCVEILSKVVRNRKNPTFVFCNEDGMPIKQEHLNDRIFKSYVLRSKVKMIRLHDLRTTYASNFMVNGGNIFNLSRILGHSSIEMTSKRYAHLSPDHLTESAEIFSTTTLNQKTNVIGFSPKTAQNHFDVSSRLINLGS